MYLNKLKNIFISAIIPLILYSSILLIFYNKNIDPILILRDINQTYDIPFGVGIISTIGIILWFSTSAILFFILFTNLIKNYRNKNYIFFGAILTFILGIDDLFLIHDRYIKEEYLYLFYIIFSGIYLIRFFQISKIYYFPTLIFSLSALGSSLIIDQFQSYLPFEYLNTQIIEEGLKFIGITSWFLYWLKTSKKFLIDINRI